MYSDPIADFLTRVRNAISAGHRVVEIPASNLKKEMTKILFRTKPECKAHFQQVCLSIPLHNDLEALLKVERKHPFSSVHQKPVWPSLGFFERS